MKEEPGFGSRTPACAYCGSTGVGFHLDHVVPLSRGGPDTPANLVAACATCNSRKGNLLPSEWLRVVPAEVAKIEARVADAISYKIGRSRRRKRFAPALPQLGQCYWCSREIDEKHDGILEFCDQETAPYLADTLDRLLPTGAREQVGQIQWPGTGHGRVNRHEWSGYRLAAHLAHEWCGPQDVYGYRIGLTKIGSPASVVDWRRQIGTKTWFKLWLCDEIDVAAAASRACEVRKVVGFG